MTRLHLDFETRGTVNLPAAGVHVYATHADTDIWCAAWAIDDGDVELWRPEEPLSAALRSALSADDVIICAHNAAFEWHIIEYIAAPRYGWPRIPVDRLDCTAARAAIQCLPRDLAGAANALGLDVEKDQPGRRLMLQMSKPRRWDGDRPVWWQDAPRRARLEQYCALDVTVERALDKKLLPMPRSERAVWLLDFEINYRRGIAVDTDFVRKAQTLVTRSQRRANEHLAELTAGRVTSTNQNAKLIEWLCDHGVATDSVNKAQIAQLLDHSDLPEHVRTVLELRRNNAKSSTAKLTKFLTRTSADGRMRDNLMYYGAGTGRFSGRGVQLQNLPRPELSSAQTDVAIKAIGANKRSSDQQIAIIELLLGSLPAAVSSCLRGAVVADQGNQLHVADYANIEGRVTAWLAGEKEKLALFAADGPIYERMAAAIFDMPVESITKESRERFLGKTVELGAGFQMGAARFRDTCHADGVDIDEATAERTIQTYRRVNSQIVTLWHGLEQAAMTAMTEPDTPHAYNGVAYLLPSQNGRHRRAYGFLLARLPSGRCLYYPQPKLQPTVTPWGREKTQLTYMSVNAVTRKWQRQSAYGGLLTENAVQAIARDILVAALLRLEKAGYPIVLTVHDEIIAETSRHRGHQAEFERLMAQPPPWAADCPLAVKGFLTERYGK